MMPLRVRLWELPFGIGLWLTGAATLLAQSNSAASAARSWRETHEIPILQEFMDLLALPDLARDDVNIRKNAAVIVKLLEKRNVKTQLLEVPGAPPVVFGEIATPGATRTLVFYAHYDGQPLDPKEWATPPLAAGSARWPVRSRRQGSPVARQRADQSRMAHLRASSVR
jgi:hypothetical protein